jgi:hypothetical protein
MFDSGSFDTGSLSPLSFDFGDIAPPVVIDTPGGGSTRQAPGRQSAQQAHLKRIIKEDMEIVTLVLAALQSGIIQ